MDENHQDKTESKLIATEDVRWSVNRKRKLWIPKHKKRTGFEDKTLWDWLQLLGVLAIPLVVVLATIAFGWWQVHLADLQHIADQQSALDQQRQATLVTYLSNMNDLLLNRGLLTSKPNDEIRVIARTETLTTMRQLDGERNGFLVQFLRDAHLIGTIIGYTPFIHVGVSYGVPTISKNSHPIVSFENVDLGKTDLSGVDLAAFDLKGSFLVDTTLSGAFLSGADLSNTILEDANMSEVIALNANLSDADLTGADLSHSVLAGADFKESFLNDANLDGALLAHANFKNADLQGADLQNAVLFNAAITQKQLDQVISCAGAILPKGLTCHHNQ